MSDMLSLSIPKYDPLEAGKIFELSATEVGSRIKQIKILDRICRYELGLLLYRINKEGLWKKQEFCTATIEYVSFALWVENEVGISYRVAAYLMFIAEALHKRNVPSDVTKDLMELGWAKAHQILRFAATVPQIKKWIANTKAQNLSEKDLARKAKIELAKRGIKAGEELLEDPPDEKEEEKKIESDILPTPVQVSVSFNHKSSYEFYSKASSVIEKKLGVNSQEEILGIMASQYIATSDPHGNIVNEVEEKIKAIENIYGVRLAVIRVRDTETTEKKPEAGKENVAKV